MEEQAPQAQPLSEEKRQRFASLAAFVGDRSLAIRLFACEIEDALKEMNEIRNAQTSGASNSSAT